MQSSQQRKKKKEKAVGQLSPKNELRKFIRNELGGASQWKNINLRAAVISAETELFAFLVDCCHETQCFAVFLPARHSSAKCDEM